MLIITKIKIMVTKWMRSLGKFHNGINWVIISLSENLDSFSLWTFGIFHNHLNVIRSKSFFWHFFTCILFYFLCLFSTFSLHFLWSFSINGALELIYFLLTSSHAIHIGLTKYNIGILWSRGFPHIWVINADHKGLSLFNCYSVYSREWFKTHLWHCLSEFLVTSVRVWMVMVMFPFISWTLVFFLFFNCFFFYLLFFGWHFGYYDI